MSDHTSIYRISWSHSDNIPGLESQLEKNKLGQLNDDVRYSIKTKSFSQMDQQFGRREERLPEPQSKIEEKIYDITKVRSRLVCRYTFDLAVCQK